MKHLLLTTIAAVLLVGCGPPEPPDISIHEAVGTGNIEAVKQHLAAGTDVNAKDDNGSTPLQFAAQDGHKKIAELLIINGADVNVADMSSMTPLHFAVVFGQGNEILELLIDKGADVNAKDDGGSTPLDLAEMLVATPAPPAPPPAPPPAALPPAEFSEEEMVEIPPVPEFKTDFEETINLLRKHGGKKSAELDPVAAIHKAVELGSLEDVKQLLADGVDVDAKNKLGWTPLLWAVGDGHKEIVELLIANGADVNAKRSDGGTSLGWAIGRGYTEIADLLRKHGGKTGAELKAEGK
jgi:ankyrin repeat protein